MVKTVWTAVSCQILSTAFKQQHWIPPQLGTDITTAAPLNGPYNLRDCDLPAVAATVTDSLTLWPSRNTRLPLVGNTVTSLTIIQNGNTTALRWLKF